MVCYNNNLNNTENIMQVWILTVSVEYESCDQFLDVWLNKPTHDSLSERLDEMGYDDSDYIADKLLDDETWGTCEIGLYYFDLSAITPEDV